jgi:hypothetical protein
MRKMGKNRKNKKWLEYRKEKEKRKEKASQSMLLLICT